MGDGCGEGVLEKLPWYDALRELFCGVGMDFSEEEK